MLLRINFLYSFFTGVLSVNWIMHCIAMCLELKEMSVNSMDNILEKNLFCFSMDFSKKKKAFEENQSLHFFIHIYSTKTISCASNWKNIVFTKLQINMNVLEICVILLLLLILDIVVSLKEQWRDRTHKLFSLETETGQNIWNHLLAHVEQISYSSCHHCVLSEVYRDT